MTSSWKVMCVLRTRELTNHIIYIHINRLFWNVSSCTYAGRLRKEVAQGRRVKDQNSCYFTMSQTSLQVKIKRAETLCVEWIGNRQEVRRELIKLADKLNEHQKNVNIAKVTGSSAAIVGTGLAIGGFVASFFTFGASLIVSAVGAGIGGAGGATAGGAGIVNQFLRKDIYKDVQKYMDRDQELTERLQSQIEEIEFEVDSIKRKGLEKLKLTFCDGVEIVFQVFKNSLWNIGKMIVYESIQTAKVLKDPARLTFAAVDLAADTGLNVFRAFTATGRALHIAGFVAGVLFLPVDIYTLVTSSNELNDGNVTEAEKKIRDIIEKMVCPQKYEIPNMLVGYVKEEFEKEIELM